MNWTASGLLPPPRRPAPGRSAPGPAPLASERVGDPDSWAHDVARVLGAQEGFHGADVDYRRLESSLLHRVLERRRGLPILLSAVWLEVARRAGIPVYGVALPGHFVVGFGDPYGTHVLADPFDGGRPLGDTEAAGLVAGGEAAGLTARILEPARPLEMVARMLNNIRAWAASRPEHSAVQLWALELSLLLPSRPARLRYERAQVLVQRGEYLRGAAELEGYADIVEPVEPSTAQSLRAQAASARAMLN